MSKKFFRPPQGDFDVDEESDEESDEDEEAVSNKASAPTGSNAVLSSDDDDEDDDENETKKRGKRRSGASPQRKKYKASSFFDMEAEASDDDDDEEDYNDKDGEHMDEEAKELIRQQDRRRAASGRFGERSVAEISRDIEKRHRMQNRLVDRTALVDRAIPEVRVSSSRRETGDAVSNGGGGMVNDAGTGVGFSHAVAQQSLMPSVSDPSLWMVSCLTGKEQELVFQIMNKCTAFARQSRPLGISAIIAAQSKGKIYVESFSEPAVMEAIQNVRGLFQGSMRLLPIGDMTTVSEFLLVR